MMMNKGLVHKQKKHLPGPNPVYEKEYRPSKTISKKDKDNEKNAPSRKKHLAGPASVFQEDIVQNKKLFHEKYTSPYARDDDAVANDTPYQEVVSRKKMVVQPATVQASPQRNYEENAHPSIVEGNRRKIIQVPGRIEQESFRPGIKPVVQQRTLPFAVDLSERGQQEFGGFPKQYPSVVEDARRKIVKGPEPAQEASYRAGLRVKPKEVTRPFASDYPEEVGEQVLNVQEKVGIRTYFGADGRHAPFGNNVDEPLQKPTESQRYTKRFDRPDYNSLNKMAQGLGVTKENYKELAAQQQREADRQQQGGNVSKRTTGSDLDAPRNAKNSKESERGGRDFEEFPPQRSSRASSRQSTRRGCDETEDDDNLGNLFRELGSSSRQSTRDKHPSSHQMQPVIPKLNLKLLPGFGY